MKKIICLLLLVIFCFSVPVYAIEDDEDEENNENKIVMVYIFNKEDESISASAIDYLKELKNSEIGEYFDYRVLTVWDKNWNENTRLRKIGDMVAEHFEETLQGSPYIVIGDDYSLDTYTEQFNEDIKDEIIDCYEYSGCKDIVKEYLDEYDKTVSKNNVITIFLVGGFVLVVGLFIYFARRNVK